MAKKPVKKSAAKSAKSGKSGVKAGKSSKGAGKKVSAKKPLTSRKGISKKTSPKKTISDKERELRAANLIANSEKKKSVKSKSLKSVRPKKIATDKQVSALLDAIVEGMQEKKARNIVMLNLTNIEHRVSDYFVICDADSKTHVEAIAGSVEELVYKRSSEKAYHSEGQQNSEWILIDYINVVAHVFLRETRDHYNIEALWGDAEMTLIN